MAAPGRGRLAGPALPDAASSSLDRANRRAASPSWSRRPAARPIAVSVAGDRRRAESAGAATLVDRLDAFDLAIFVSPTAARRGIALIRRPARAARTALRIAAIGRGIGARARAARGAGRHRPRRRRYDSEALLALPQLQAVQGTLVIVFRGEGGRELLGDDARATRGDRSNTPSAIGATRPQADAQALLRALSRGEVHAVTVTSAEGLNNLFDMVGTLGRHWLRKTPLFAPHARIAERARELGIADGRRDRARATQQWPRR